MSESHPDEIDNLNDRIELITFNPWNVGVECDTDFQKLAGERSLTMSKLGLELYTDPYIYFRLVEVEPTAFFRALPERSTVQVEYSPEYIQTDTGLISICKSKIIRATKILPTFVTDNNIPGNLLVSCTMYSLIENQLTKEVKKERAELLNKKLSNYKFIYTVNKFLDIIEKQHILDIAQNGEYEESEY